MGDLVLTCTGDLSRNRRVGLALGQGKTLAEILAEMKQVAEGVKTTKVAHELARQARRRGADHRRDVRASLHEGMPVREALDAAARAADAGGRDYAPDARLRPRRDLRRSTARRRGIPSGPSAPWRCATR